jgi:hypothetical protein
LALERLEDRTLLSIAWGDLGTQLGQLGDKTTGSFLDYMTSQNAYAGQVLNPVPFIPSGSLGNLQNITSVIDTDIHTIASSLASLAKTQESNDAASDIEGTLGSLYGTLVPNGDVIASYNSDHSTLTVSQLIVHVDTTTSLNISQLDLSGLGKFLPITPNSTNGFQVQAGFDFYLNFTYTNGSSGPPGTFSLNNAPFAPPYPLT